MCDDRRYEDAAEVIKGAILRSQYRAVKRRMQLRFGRSFCRIPSQYHPSIS